MTSRTRRRLRRLSNVIKFIPRHVVRSVKNTSRSNVDVLVRNTTSSLNKHMNAKLLKQLYKESNNRDNFGTIFGILWKRLMDYSSKIHVFKATIVLIYILQNSNHALLYCQESLHHIHTLEDIINRFNSYNDDLSSKIKDSLRILYDYLCEYSTNDDGILNDKSITKPSLERSNSLSKFFANMGNDIDNTTTTDSLNIFDILFDSSTSLNTAIKKININDDDDDDDDGETTATTFNTMVDLINNEAMFSIFKEFAIKDECISFVNCWFDCYQFRCNYSDNDITSSLSTAMFIYDNYIASITASEPINPPESLRSSIQAYLTSPTGYLDDDYPDMYLYQTLEAHLFTFLNQKKIPKFKKTAEFQALYNELCRHGDDDDDKTVFAQLPPWVVREIEYTVDSFRESIIMKRRNEVDGEQMYEKRRMKRELIYKELLSTEETYVNTLGFLINVYLLPLKDEMIAKSLGMYDYLSLLFQNIEEIYELHCEFLTSLHKLSTTTDAITSLLLQFTPKLRIYARYIIGYKQSVEIYNKFNSDEYYMIKSWFNEQSMKCNGQSFESLLITPVQRIPRYELLCAELARQIELNDDNNNIFETYRCLKGVASYINEYKRTEEQKLQLTSVLKPKVNGIPFELFNNERGLIRYGTVRYLSNNIVNKHKTCIICLCTDMFLWLNDSYKYKNHILLSNGIIMDDLHVNHKYSFIVMGNSTMNSNTVESRLTLFCTSDDEKQQWMKDIAVAISDSQALSPVTTTATTTTAENDRIMVE